jgi:branched-chain amino acid transport system substrate-binding protein
VIGGTLGLSGKYQEMALMQRRGFELWQEQVNQNGGLLGRQVELIIEDDQRDRGRVVELYRKLLEERRVDLIFSPTRAG